MDRIFPGSAPWLSGGAEAGTPVARRRVLKTPAPGHQPAARLSGLEVVVGLDGTLGCGGTGDHRLEGAL
jgi:hypothetical protein